MNENLSCETAIIGGGLSALFLATMLARDRRHRFKLVVGPKAGLGGYAAWGYMKLGMPPAGRRTLHADEALGLISSSLPSSMSSATSSS